jgi:hypothetical protein
MARARRDAAAAAAGGAAAAESASLVEERFALAALMEVPAQFREIRRRGLLRRAGPPLRVEVLDPPRTAQSVTWPAPSAPPSAPRGANDESFARARSGGLDPQNF